MAWSNSKIFRPFLADVLGNVAAFDLDADTIKVALFDNDITPAQDVTSALSAYNAGQWVSAGNEVFDGAEWAVGGVALSGKVVDSATAATVFFDASDTASGASATLANVFGCNIYDDTLAAPVADQGICFTYFGGVQSVTDGQMTVIWHPNGIFRVTL